MNTTISLTFGDAGENHIGMELLGKIADSGFSCAQLKALGDVFEHATFHDLGMDAGILIVRNILSKEFHKFLFHEINSLQWDSKYYDRRRKKVLNKRARTNIMIIDNISQEPDYENTKGRIVDTFELTYFKKFKSFLMKKLKLVLPQFDSLICEGNKYENNKKHGIGFHGDTERRIVIALRLGASMPIHWQWFQNYKPIGERYEFNIHGGDLYIMSDKAVGHDWRKKNIPTLRHAAGAVKYNKCKKHDK